MSRHSKCVATGWDDGGVLSRQRILCHDGILKVFYRDRESLDLWFPCHDIALMSRQGTTKARGNRAPWECNRACDCVHDVHDRHAYARRQVRQGIVVTKRLCRDRPYMLLCRDRVVQ